MQESELLHHIAQRSANLAGQGVVVVGPGDDCAVVRLEGQTLITVDHLVAGRHFREDSTTIDQIARKSIARSVSDIAAMAGAPSCALATACLPMGYAQANELFDRMAAWARHFGCPLVGGDIATASGPLVLTVTVIGSAHATRGPVLRSQARVGDDVYVSGRVGGSLASGRHLAFEPRIAEGVWLAQALGDSLGAMIDLSDGLGRDAGRIACASSVRVEIVADAIPLYLDVADWREGVSGGEDYELLFTVRPGTPMPESCPTTGTSVTRIGRVVSGQPVAVVKSIEGVVDVTEYGWDHR